MKKILFCISLFVFGLSTVYGDCTDSDVEQYKKEASSINVSYEINKDIVDAFGDRVYDGYVVTFKNLYDNYYVEDSDTGIRIGKDYLYEGQTAENNTYVTENITKGAKKLNVYHNGCSTVLKTIELSLPYYNQYYNDELCDGVDKNKVKLCNKWIDKDVTYGEFYNEVSKYKKDTEKGNFADNIVDFFKNNYITVIVAVLIFIIIVVFTSIRKKKRLVV